MNRGGREGITRVRVTNKYRRGGRRELVARVVRGAWEGKK